MGRKNDVRRERSRVWTRFGGKSELLKLACSVTVRKYFHTLTGSRYLTSLLTSQTFVPPQSRSHESLVFEFERIALARISSYNHAVCQAADRAQDAYTLTFITAFIYCRCRTLLAHSSGARRASSALVCWASEDVHGSQRRMWAACF